MADDCVNVPVSERIDRHRREIEAIAMAASKADPDRSAKILNCCDGLYGIVQELAAAEKAAAKEAKTKKRKWIKRESR